MFEPFKPFEPLPEMELLKSAELARNIEDSLLATRAREDLTTCPEDDNSKDETSHAKPFEPLKPLELPSSLSNVKQFEPLKPFEAETGESTGSNLQDGVEPKETERGEDNSGLVADVPASVEEFQLLTSDGEPYIPVVPLEPLNLEEFLKPITQGEDKNEIQEDKIKNSLKEIISDLDTYVEKDRDLREGEVENEKKTDGVLQEVLNGGKQDVQVRYTEDLFQTFTFLTC